ncbi:AI-2E family transporter [Edaphobacter sp.]|uniref:AI-2E family transporter n=1 Tax=Edaphobacter sp. TaxID=1934404 RepID=UPI002DBA80E0|nr:AI-2E family transporter [Edaphobacter sp.]HEU5341938.1 AI-2E family transporter [Edaphobacter sp.]
MPTEHTNRILLAKETALATSPPDSINPASPNPDPTPAEAASRRAVRGHILFCFGVALLLLLAWSLRKEILIIYVAALFAAVLIPVVNRITDWEFRSFRASRPVAIILLIAAVAGVLALFATAGMPPVLRDLRQFSNDLPQRIPIAVARLKHLPLADRIGVDTLAERAETALTASASYLVSALPEWLSHLFDILTAAFLCVYFMLEGGHAYDFFLSLFPLPQRARLDLTLHHANLKISKWLVGQGLLMLILGVSSTIVFGLLHVRYFLLLGFLMGLFNIIPIAGGIFIIIISAGVAALDSWAKMAGVLIFYIVYVNIENAYLIPRIMRSSVNLMGLTVLVALLLGTSLAGIVGALVAVPTAALIAVVLNEYAVQQDKR